MQVVTFAEGKYFGFFYSDGAQFVVDHAGQEIWADWPAHYTLEDACPYLLGPVMGFVLRLRGVISLHASGVVICDHAIALVGSAGAGKSTTAAAFSQLGYSVLSDDVVALADSGDRFLVQPGYPRLNLWPDAVRTLLGSEDALPLSAPTWKKRYMPLGQSGREFARQPLPLGAIYVLGWRDTAPPVPVIESMASHDALLNLIGNTYVNYLLDDDMRRAEFDVLSRVVASVPVHRVRPTADPSGLLDLCKAIASDARGRIVFTGAASGTE